MAKILLADDDPQIQLAIKATLSKFEHDVVIVNNGKLALDLASSESFDLIISDEQMPIMTGLELLQGIQQKDLNIPFVIITAHGTITRAVEAMQIGASDFITKPFVVSDLIRVVDKALHTGHEILKIKEKKSNKQRPIITNDALMIKVLEVSEAVARSDATVLIQGESGTGKELIARLIHTSSTRKCNSFVAVNCAALPETLLESELFGHEKGSFTGALNKKLGKFELAHGGTILLDEISEMELTLQAKLLRVLQEREVDRVGGKEPVSIDVRVVATTNRNLEEMVREGKFRADLYYRLNVIPLTVPPLRARSGDIRLLVRHFMLSFLGNDAPYIPDEVMLTLETYPWPGNIRELQNAVERAAILSKGNIIQKEDFLLCKSKETNFKGVNINYLEDSPNPEFQAHVAKEENQDNSNSQLKSGTNYEVSNNNYVYENLNGEQRVSNSNLKPVKVISAGTTVQEMEKELIIETLKATNNNRTQAAKMLGISIRTLRNKLNEYKMSVD